MDIFEVEQKIMDINEGKISKEQCTQDAMSMIQLANLVIDIYMEKKILRNY